MYSQKKFKSQKELYSYLKLNSDVYFFGAFLREIDSHKDELIIIIRTCRIINFSNIPVIINKQSNREILTTIIERGEDLLNYGEIIYGAYIFQNEIYDFYGKKTTGIKNHILRLHYYENNYFPFRKLGKPDITEKNKFIFPDIEGDGLVCVPVGPIHAGIIPPGHFRFLVDGEDALDLEIQLGWKTRLVDKYFMEETNLYKLIEASEEIVGDSSVAYSIGFVRNIESSTNIKPTLLTQATRIVMLELERIYNHLWTIGALCNDVGQAYILNGFLSVREEVLDINNQIFKSRLLKGNINIGNNNIELDINKIEIITKKLNILLPRIKNLVNIIKFSSGMYDRFRDTGIVKKEIALKHNALGVVAKGSMISIDSRTTDEYYINLNLNEINIAIGEVGDSFDRLMVRAEEVFQSIEIINEINNKFQKGKIVTSKKQESQKIQNPKLKNGYYISNIEGHRGENLQIMIVENNIISYYKHKDPSFVNWGLLEYSVLNNIIADFPICNKSFDLSYSGFDM